MGFEIRKIESDIMEYAIDIAFKFNVSIYDAYFLALSQTINMPFITADYKFAERVKSFRGPALLNQGSWPGIVRLSEL
jgi:predicted nucleic acid-binding protein